MASGMALESNVEILREYTRRVLTEHDLDLAPEYVTADVKWHGGTLGTDVYRLTDGKISEQWAADDLTAILHQVGAYTHGSPSRDPTTDQGDKI